MIALVHEDFAVRADHGRDGRREYRGHDGDPAVHATDLSDHWEFFETDPGLTTTTSATGCVALGCWHARGRASGVEINGQPATWLACIRDGKIARWRTYTDATEALTDRAASTQTSVDREP